MKGKIAFVLGAAVGYVLGTRAGRERYEQIKRGAQAVWQTEPVQQGVGAVQGVVGDGLTSLKNAAVQSGKDALSSLLQQGQQGSSGQQRAAGQQSSSTSSTRSSAQASTSGTAKGKASPKAQSSKPGAGESDS